MSKKEIVECIVWYEKEIKTLEATAKLYPESRSHIYQVIDYYGCCIGYLQDLIMR